MAHRCFISFKTEDGAYKKYIQEKLHLEMINHSLDEAINSDDEEYIMRKIRQDYLSDSTVTIHLIGQNSAESKSYEEQKYIKRELQASLYHGPGNTQNGILGVILPSMYDWVFNGSYTCGTCAMTHNAILINDNTVIKEFSYNYYLPSPNNKCSWFDDDMFCVLVKWDDFTIDPNRYIDLAFAKRTHPVAEKTKVYL